MKTIRIKIPADPGDALERLFGTIKVTDDIYQWLTTLTNKIPMSKFHFYPVQYDEDTMTAYLTPDPLQKSNVCDHHFQPVLGNRIEQRGKNYRPEIQECIGAICTKCGKFKKENPNG